MTMLALGRTPFGMGRRAVGKAAPAWARSLLLDKNYAAGRFFFHGMAYPSEAAINAVAGTVKSGEARITGPLALGADLFVNGDPVADLTGWSAQNGALLSAVGGELVVDANGGTNATGHHAIPTQVSHAYKVTAKYRRGTATNNVIVAIMTAGLSTRNSTPANATTVDLEGSATFGAEGASMVAGLRVAATAASGTAIGSEFRCTECVPFDGFTPGGFAARIAFTAPSSVASDQCLLEAHGNNQNKITAVLRATDSHLVVTVTFGGSIAAALDLGAISLGTPHVLEMSNASNRFMARLDGGDILADQAGTIPGIAVLYEGRSNTGQTWTGTIDRFTVFDRERVPDNAISMDGDSFSSAGGVGGVSGQATLAAVAGRPVFSTGVGGSDVVAQAARVVANRGLYAGVFVHWDADNNGYDLEADKATFTALAGAAPRHLFLTTTLRANKTEAANAAAAARNAWLASFFGDACFDCMPVLLGLSDGSAPDLAAVADGHVPPSCLSDGTHLTQAAMTAVMTAVWAHLLSLGY